MVAFFKTEPYFAPFNWRWPNNAVSVANIELYNTLIPTPIHSPTNEVQKYIDEYMSNSIPIHRVFFITKVKTYVNRTK